MYHNDKKYALTNCVLLDGSEHMEPQTGKAVCIDGEKINEIVDAQHIPAGYEAVDLGGKYVLPGLINMHVHLPASGKPKKKASDPKKLVKLITFCALTNRIGVSMCEGYAGRSGNHWVGLLSAGYFLPQIITILGSIFYEAWQLSAVTEETDRQAFFSKIFRVYASVLRGGHHHAVPAAHAGVQG
jgi:hypothetical protein